MPSLSDELMEQVPVPPDWCNLPEDFHKNPRKECKAIADGTILVEGVSYCRLCKWNEFNQQLEENIGDDFK